MGSPGGSSGIASRWASAVLAALQALEGDFRDRATAQEWGASIGRALAADRMPENG